MCQRLGPLSHYLGVSTVTSHRITSRGLVPVEEITPNLDLPLRYPTGMSWVAEMRLLFPHFLSINSHSYVDGQDGPNSRTVLPYKTLLQASKLQPMLFASLVFQRVHDSYMPWPNLSDFTHETRWRVCNMTKFPPLRAEYPVEQARVNEIRSRLNQHRQGAAGFAANMADFLPAILTPEERDILQSCREIDNRYQADCRAFLSHSV